LRDVSGLQNENIGLGNEKALNQLMAHHGVVFKPKELKMWVSNNPYQLGAFDAYDLNSIFNSSELKPINALEIPKDVFLNTQEFANYKKFRVLYKTLDQAINSKSTITDEILAAYEKINPELWLVYKQLGDYSYNNKEWQKASNYYKTALQKTISSTDQRKSIEKQLIKTLKKL